MDRTRKSWINAILLAVTLVINTLGAFGLINGLRNLSVFEITGRV